MNYLNVNDFKVLKIFGFLKVRKLMWYFLMPKWEEVLIDIQKME